MSPVFSVEELKNCSFLQCKFLLGVAETNFWRVAWSLCPAVVAFCWAQHMAHSNGRNREQPAFSAAQKPDVIRAEFVWFFYLLCSVLLFSNLQCDELRYLQGLVVPLQLSAQSLQFTASQHSPAVLTLQLVLLLHDLEQLLLQNLQLFLITAMLLQLHKHTVTTRRWTMSFPTQNSSEDKYASFFLSFFFPFRFAFIHHDNWPAQRASWWWFRVSVLACRACSNFASAALLLSLKCQIEFYDTVFVSNSYKFIFLTHCFTLPMWHSTIKTISLCPNTCRTGLK